MVQTDSDQNIPSSTKSVVLHQHKEGQLFAEKPNKDLYWEALLQVANNHKDQALKLVSAMRSNSEAAAVLPWKAKQPVSIDVAFDKLFLSTVQSNPEWLSYLGLFESIGIREHNAYLRSTTPGAVRLEFQEKKENLQMLKKYSEDSLSLTQQLSYKIFTWTLHHEVAGEAFLFHDYPVNQMFGVVQDLTALFTLFHQLSVPEDVDNYLKRLACIPQKMTEVIELLDYQKTKGIVPPRFAVEKAIHMVDKFVAVEPQKNIFYTHLLQKITQMEMKDKEKVAAEAEKLLKNVVYPAYMQLQKYLIKLLEAAKENHGVWALPQGDAYYAHLLQRHTTTDFTADEIHQIGYKEVAKIAGEMRKLLEEEGYPDPQKSIGELMLKLSANKAYYYPDSDLGRKECLEGFQGILDRSRQVLGPLFDIKPKAPVLIAPVPKHEEEGAAAAYYWPGSIDGSRPGVFYVNLRDMQEIPKFGMETLTIHESEPGHHFQIAIQNEMEMPVLRKALLGFTAYVEGWALYTEKLAYEQGFYQTAADKLGHLQDEMMRAVRLVVDTGIHHKRWTREKAVDYMVEQTGMPREAVVTEVERYFVMPGQACSYKIGQLKILELRDKAKEALGDRFDIREFHNAVLRLGAAPLSVLEEIIEDYITAQNLERSRRQK